jgi:hypothetical protein
MLELQRSGQLPDLSGFVIPSALDIRHLPFHIVL